MSKLDSFFFFFREALKNVYVFFYKMQLVGETWWSSESAGDWRERFERLSKQREAGRVYQVNVTNLLSERAVINRLFLHLV